MIILITSLLLLLLLGVPVVVSIGLSSFLTLLSFLSLGDALGVLARQSFGGVDSFPLIAIPLFILAGNLMNSGGIARRLIKLASVLGNRLPGAILHTNVLGNMLFGAVSGSAAAAAVAVGGVIEPQARKEGYDPDFSACVNISSAPTGLLIPPSNTLILYSVVSAKASVLALFLAGYLPGIIMGLTVMVCVALLYKRNCSQKVHERQTGKFGLALLDALPSLMLIIIIVGGIIYGVFTASEGAGIAVAYAFLLSLVYRQVNWRGYLKVLLDSARVAGMLLLIIASSNVMSWVLAYLNIPERFAAALLSISDNKYVLLLLINLCLLFIGTFLDMSPAILIFTPIFLPVAVDTLGLHPVHFGIILTYNLCIGIITPPVGNCLFVGAGIAQRKVETIMRKILPFYFALFLGLMLVTFVPWFSLGLPRFLGAI